MKLAKNQNRIIGIPIEKTAILLLAKLVGRPDSR